MSEQTLTSNAVAPPRPDHRVEERAAFLVRTYAHLLGAVVGFVALEILYFSTGLSASIARPLLSVPWLLVLGAFIVISFLARNLASRSLSQRLHYVGLGTYVVAESVIFVPLLYVADFYAPGAIQSAASLTILGFVGLTAIAFRTGKDFSFLSSLIRWAGVVAIVAIVGAVLFELQLGTWFSIGMVGLAGAAILFDTSAILREYPADRHVAAALELFASIALMFWYLVSFFTSRE